MKLTPVTIRLDKKCGKSGVADNKKCGKSTTARNVAIGVAAAGAVGGLTFAVLRRKGKGMRAVPSRQTPTVPIQSEAQPKPPSRQPALTKTAIPQPSRTNAPIGDARPTSPLKAFIDHAQKTEGAKPFMWAKEDNFLIAKNELGSRYGYTLTPDGHFISMKVGQSGEVDFDVKAYSNTIPKEVSAETAKRTLTRMQRMMNSALRGVPEGTELWAATGQMNLAAKSALSTRNTGKLPPRARLFKMLGFEFDPESGESYTTVDKARRLLGKVSPTKTERRYLEIRRQLQETGESLFGNNQS